MLPRTMVTGDFDLLYSQLYSVVQTYAKPYWAVHECVQMPSFWQRGSSDYRGILIPAFEPSGNRCHSLLHELTHVIFHWVDGRPVNLESQVRECQAEATAFCCARVLNLPSPNSVVFFASLDISSSVLREHESNIGHFASTIMSYLQSVGS
jgi:hypothetical protein